MKNLKNNIMKDQLKFKKIYIKGKFYFYIYKKYENKNVLIGKLINVKEENEKIDFMDIQVKNNFHFIGNDKVINIFDLQKIIDIIKYLNITNKRDI